MNQKYVSSSTQEIGVRLVPLNMFEFSRKFLLADPRRWIFCGSFYYLCCLVCAMQPYNHLLRKTDLLSLFVLCFLVFCHFPIRCSGTDEVLDFIDS